MSILQDLSKHPEAAVSAIRDAKDAKHLTNVQLSHITGIPESSLSKLLANPRSDPRVSTFIALCRALDLSADSLFGLCPPESSPAELQQRLRAAELENARLAEANKFLAGLLSARTPIVYILLVACVLQSCALIVYLFIDAHILSAGLIRFGDIGFVAWLLIGLILAAIGSCVWATMRFARKSSKRSADHARPRA